MSNDPIYSGKDLWEDPLAEHPSGLLLSDRISYYAQKCKMVVPFEKKDLRSSYYTLHIGDEYWTGREKHEMPDGGSVEIKPNGFVYIRVKEFLNLPFYIVARYSLCVTLVYRGLMLDNGLQIDPGFRGNIHVPVYNFTDDIKYLKRDDPFLSMEFVKTSFSLKSSDLDKIDDLDELYGSSFEGIEGHPLKMFKKIRNRSLLEYFKPEDKNKSSVLALHDRVNTFKNDTINEIDLHKKDINQRVSKTNTIGIVSLLGLIIAMCSIILTHFYWQEGKFSSLNSRFENIKNEVEEGLLTQIEENYEKTGLELTELEKKRNDTIKLVNETERKLGETKIIFETIKSQAETAEEQFGTMEKLQKKQIKELEDKIIELESLLSNSQNKGKDR